MVEIHPRFHDDLADREDGGSDSPRLSAYAAAMAGGEPYIQLKLEVDQPLELGDFVSAFTALGSEYDRYIKNREGGDAHATLYVQEIRQGSIIADLIPVLASIPNLADTMGRVLAVEDFVRRYAGRLLSYVVPGGKAPDVTTAALNAFHNQMDAVAHNPGSKLSLAAIEIKNGEHEVREVFTFDTAQARAIQENVEVHRYQIENAVGGAHERVLMVFTRADVRMSALGKRSGEQVVIEPISKRSMPLIYNSELAEQQIKHEITEAEDNLFKKGFVVDVTVDERQGRPAAYRVTNLHQVIDLDDD